MREAELVRRIRLLRGDVAAARPLRTAVTAGVRDRADHAIAIDEGAPHVEVEPAVLLRPPRGERRVQLGVRRQLAASRLHITLIFIVVARVRDTHESATQDAERERRGEHSYYTPRHDKLLLSDNLWRDGRFWRPAHPSRSLN